jgi:hypothetical protein
MSMSQGNAALVMDVYAETARLGITLTQAERMVEQSAQRMGQKVDSTFGQIGNKITKMLGAAVGAGFAIKVVDDALRKVAEGIRESQGAKAIGEAVGNSIVESIRGVPVVGALMEVASQASNAVLGDPMGRNAAIAQYQDFQRQQQELRRLGAEAMGELELQAVSDPQVLARAERAREVARLRAIAERAVAGSVETTTGGVERELVPGIRSTANEFVANALRIYDEKVAARNAQEIEKIAQERRRSEERAAEEEQRRREAQEDAYDRFISGNTQEAILALEAQLEMATAGIAPTRNQRLADLMSGMGGIATGDTALGAFTFATGDAAEISRGILEKATEQLAVLERIEDIQRRIAEMREGLN